MSHLLSACNLSRRFGGVVALDDITFRIDDHELVCIIGPNGAGKSTLLNILCGVVKQDSGTLHYTGLDLANRAEHEFARLGIVRKFQVPTVFTNMSVRQNLKVAGDASGKTYTEDKIDGLLDRLTLRDVTEVEASGLAHGDRQRLELGLCLMCEPRLLLLDEPAAGLTTQETMQIALLIRELISTMAVVVIEHDMSFVRQLSGRTCVMHQGRIIRDGMFSEIEVDDLVRDIYLGRE
jgi:ABC-type uncharacterized transport system ATPase subunit